MLSLDCKKILSPCLSGAEILNQLRTNRRLEQDAASREQVKLAKVAAQAATTGSPKGLEQVAQAPPPAEALAREVASVLLGACDGSAAGGGAETDVASFGAFIRLRGRPASIQPSIPSRIHRTSVKPS